jgi:hypothetical protein
MPDSDGVPKEDANKEHANALRNVVRAVKSSGIV